MLTVNLSIDFDEIPHGHGLSFKRGVSDGLLGEDDFESKVDITHRASYRRGVTMGQNLKETIAKTIK